MSQQIDCGGQRKLRGSETGDKITAADAAALFQRLQHIVNSAESARNVLCSDSFAGEHAVAIEQLQRQGHGWPQYCSARFQIPSRERSGSSDQRPWAFGGVVRRERKTIPVCERRCGRAESGRVV